MSTHNICFDGELTKIFFNYHHIPFLSVLLLTLHLYGTPPSHLTAITQVGCIFKNKTVENNRNVRSENKNTRCERREE